ncbi:MAG: hypothetical protein KBI02_09205 [Thermomonas sp.]|uniref:hypothetical protein n=1 Tax=Thermomonas sp. TaxID=1971895 RepID=UPI001B6A444C|nr:hypothetical protein [Thermomonas sp.]MBP8648567.1 hypothetical protein [Thermomonas sp.]MBP9229793.1 hypothetical protein [Azonexus sp.]
MRTSRALALSLTLVFTVFPPGGSQAQVAQVAESVGTGVMIDQIFSGLNELIDHATDSGDYLLARAGIEAKESITAWKSANSDLLDKAFSELDAASRENFARAQQLIANANAGVGDRLETTQQITENANQIVESIPLSGKDSYILRFLPRIVPPTGGNDFLVRIRGVNLDRADPQIHLGNRLAERTLTGPLEAQFKIPRSSLPAASLGTQVIPLKVTYSTPRKSLWGKISGGRERVARELALIRLPDTIGTYRGTAIVKTSTREAETVSWNLDQFKATKRREYRMIKPGDGWIWDMSAPMSLAQGKGEKGRCEGIVASESSKDGLKVFAHLDEIKDRRHPFGAPGYVNCTLKATRYKDLPGTRKTLLAMGSLTWGKDSAIDLPEGVESLEISVTTFDGRTRLFTGTGTDKFFDVRREPERLLIEPKVPNDLL